MRVNSGHGGSSTSQDTAARTEKVIKTVKRRRKQRYHRLREMIQGFDDGEGDNDRPGCNGEVVCPVCLETVSGGPDVTEAHVDACLAQTTPSAHEDVEGPSRTRVTDGVNLTGLIPPPSQIPDVDPLALKCSSIRFLR